MANRKDGSVRAFDAASWKMLSSTSYGDNADNLRLDSSSGHAWVGYGGGALGEFDQEGTKLADIKLDAHPESFQLEKNGSRIFVNLPRSGKIAVVDRRMGTVSASWGTGGPLANYPMALDGRDHRLFVVTRFPARLIVLDTDQGEPLRLCPPSVIATTSSTTNAVIRYMRLEEKVGFRCSSNEMPTTMMRLAESRRSVVRGQAFSQRTSTGYTLL